MKTYTITCVVCSTSLTLKSEKDYEDISWVCSLCQDSIDDECTALELDEDEDEIYGNS